MALGDMEGQRGPIFGLTEGRYRAVVANGVPIIESAESIERPTLLVPASPEFVAQLASTWSEPVRFKIEDGELIMKVYP